MARALRELLIREDVDDAEARVLEAVYGALGRVPSWAELQDVKEALERGDVLRFTMTKTASPARPGGGEDAQEPGGGGENGR